MVLRGCAPGRRAGTLDVGWGLSASDGCQGSRAGDGNRTRVTSLEGSSSTIELHPPVRLRRAYHLALWPDLDPRPAITDTASRTELPRHLERVDWVPWRSAPGRLALRDPGGGAAHRAGRAGGAARGDDRGRGERERQVHHRGGAGVVGRTVAGALARRVVPGGAAQPLRPDRGLLPGRAGGGAVVPVVPRAGRPAGRA